MCRWKCRSSVVAANYHAFRLTRGSGLSSKAPAPRTSTWIKAFVSVARQVSIASGTSRQLATESVGRPLAWKTDRNREGCVPEKSHFEHTQPRYQRILSVADDTEIARRTSFKTSLGAPHPRVARREAVAKIAAAMSTEGIVKDCFAYTALISGCAAGGDLSGAEASFDEMMASRISPNLRTFNAMIHACAKVGNKEKATHYFAKIAEANLTSDAISYGSMLQCCAKVGDSEGAIQWLQDALKNQLMPDVKSYTSIIYSFAKRGNVSEAACWLRRMREVKLKPDEFAYTIVISACAKKGDPDLAAAWLHEMVQVDLHPNVVTYSAAMKGFAKRGDVDSAHKLLRAMQHQCLVPNVVSWTSLIEACAKAFPRRTEDAERYFTMMLAAGVKPDKATMHTLTRAVGFAESAALCEKLGVLDCD